MSFRDNSKEIKLNLLSLTLSRTERNTGIQWGATDSTNTKHHVFYRGEFNTFASLVFLTILRRIALIMKYL